MTQQNNQIQIKADDHTLRGVYSNAANILHTKEEFVLDFMNIIPPTGTLNSRVIVSPGHFKQLVVAMQDNLKKYEAKFGNVQPAEVQTNPIGFQPKS
ncbi:MAG: DUF3467 domain-containing protein [Patescibacteria group bacterium]